jgi:hypothetical protein
LLAQRNRKRHLWSPSPAEYLGLYDGQIDGWDPSPGYKEERRQVIAEMFARLLRLVESRSEDRETAADGKTESEPDVR